MPFENSAESLRAKEAARVRAYRAKRERESDEDDAQCAVEALQSLHFSGARASDAPRALLRPHSLLAPIRNSPQSHARAPPFKTEAPGQPAAAADFAQHAATARACADATVAAPAHELAATARARADATVAAPAHAVAVAAPPGAPLLAIRTSPRAAARRVRESQEDEKTQCAPLQEEEDAEMDEERNVMLFDFGNLEDAMDELQQDAMEQKEAEQNALDVEQWRWLHPKLLDDLEVDAQTLDAQELDAANFPAWQDTLQGMENAFEQTAPLHAHILRQAALYSEQIYGRVDSRVTLLSKRSFSAPHSY